MNCFANSWRRNFPPVQLKFDRNQTIIGVLGINLALELGENLMIARANKSIRVTAVAFVAAIFMTTCTSTSDEFPPIANPPAFDYADGEELRSAMHQLAFELQQLDSSLGSVFGETPNFRQQVVDSLRDIERIASDIRTDDLAIRHPFLMDDMQRFLSDVERAISDASRNSPRYYMAGKISGGCTNCHNQNR